MLFQWAAVTFSIHTPFKVLFFVKNIGQWNAKSGPKASYGNFAMRKKNSGSLKKKWKRKGRNGSHFAHTHTHSAKLVVRILYRLTIFNLWYQSLKGKGHVVCSFVHYSILASVLQGTSLEVSVPPYLPSCDGPPLIAPLPLSVAPSFLRSLPPSPLPLAPYMHSSVPSSLVPFLNPPSLPILPLPPPSHHCFLTPSPCSLPPSTTLPLFPPSHPPPFVAPSLPLCRTQFNVHGVCGWQAVLSRPLLFSAKWRVARRQWGIHSCRRRSFNDKLVHSAYVLPRRIRFFTNSKKSDDRNVLQTQINTVDARSFPTVHAATPRAT